MSRLQMKAWCDRKKSLSGFTALEILFAVLILCLIGAVAIPAFSNWLPAYHLRAACQDLFGNLQLAKTSAIEKGFKCTVCFYQPIEGSTYHYVIFIDSDNDCEYDPGEQVLVRRTWGGEEFPGISFDPTKGGGDGITFSDNDENIPAISFQPSGIPVSNSGGLGMGTAYLINKKGKTAKVIVSCSGNIRVE